MLIVGELLLRQERRGDAGEHELTERVVPGGADGGVEREHRLGGAAGQGGDTGKGATAVERARAHDDRQGRLVGERGEDPRDLRLGVAIAAAAGRDEDDALRGIEDAETCARDVAWQKLPSLAREHRPDVHEPPFELPRDEDRVVGLRHENEIVEPEHCLEIRARRHHRLHGAVDEGLVPAEIEGAEQLAERAAREGVDDEEIGPEETQRVPDPLLGEREVRGAIDPGLGDDGLGRDLERGEALREHQRVGLARREKPDLELLVERRSVAPKPARDGEQARQVPHAGAVHRVADDPERRARHSRYDASVEARSPVSPASPVGSVSPETSLP